MKSFKTKIGTFCKHNYKQKIQKVQYSGGVAANLVEKCGPHFQCLLASIVISFCFVDFISQVTCHTLWAPSMLNRDPSVHKQPYEIFAHVLHVNSCN